MEILESTLKEKLVKAEKISIENLEEASKKSFHLTFSIHFPFFSLQTLQNVVILLKNPLGNRKKLFRLANKKKN